MANHLSVIAAQVESQVTVVFGPWRRINAVYILSWYFVTIICTEIVGHFARSEGKGILSLRWVFAIVQIDADISIQTILRCHWWHVRLRIVVVAPRNLSFFWLLDSKTRRCHSDRNLKLLFQITENAPRGESSSIRRAIKAYRYYYGKMSTHSRVSYSGRSNRLKQVLRIERGISFDVHRW